MLLVPTDNGRFNMLQLRKALDQVHPELQLKGLPRTLMLGSCIKEEVSLRRRWD